ncbi:LysR family transcriptional regulator [Hyphomonas pacifica]|uniref:Uncharacterized protein n=1 Tax=Hyphomonas pacifica TaxID=1280941 RepID=A0A062TZ09_9PROT|nr:LysR family transcriptional regulator [Hyphomonas pacifica]KCZ51267.1 hypothetical protein HY2_11980 [Hyphomonas pacifica]RAN31433.1 hypothetical protein HY3_16610 [Hyphomonas pacifica]
MAMKIGQLRCLIAAAEYGSFRRAGEALQMKQSSISRAIRQLEDELGVSLFERRSTGAYLTDAGGSLLREARSALEQLDLAEKTAAAAGRAEIGIVRVGILTSLAGGFLREIVRCYAHRHPEITIDIRDGGRKEHIEAVRSRKLDVAFVVGDSSIADCEIASLWRERVYVALPERHELAGRRQLDWSDLRCESFIVSRSEPGPAVHDYIVRRLSDYCTSPEILYKGVVQETLMNLVGLGQGITLVSAAWMDVKVPNLVLRPLSDPADIMLFSAVWSPLNDNPALRRFISVAHTLAGRVRRGASDWAPEALATTPVGGVSSAGARKPDPSP